MRLVHHRGKWALRDGDRRLSTGVAAGPQTRALAERAAREILARLGAARAGQTCGETIAAWLADMPNRPQPKVPSGGVLCAAKAVTAFFGDHAPAAVTRAECRAYIARRRGEGRSDGTIRKELGALAAALRWRDPATPAVFDLPPPAPPRDRWLTREELAAVLADEGLPPHIRTYIHVAIATGARAEAILTMHWSANVDFERGTLWPGFKAGGKRRAHPVPMTASARQWLYAAREMADTDHVVEWAGAPVRSVRKGLSAAYARAGVTGVAAPQHVLRHTAGAWMAQDGVPLLEIANRLGHASTATTERHYAHLHPDYMAKSTKALEIG